MYLFVSRNENLIVLEELSTSFAYVRTNKKPWCNDADDFQEAKACLVRSIRYSPSWPVDSISTEVVVVMVYSRPGKAMEDGKTPPAHLTNSKGGSQKINEFGVLKQSKYSKVNCDIWLQSKTKNEKIVRI